MGVADSRPRGRRIGAWVQIFACAAASLAAWRIELLGVTGWDGTRWIYAYPWSSVVICILVGTAACVAARQGGSWTLRRSVGVVGGVAAVSLGAFVLARWGILNAETVALAPGMFGEFARVSLLPTVAAFLLASVGIHLVSGAYRSAGIANLLRIMLAIASTIPLSLLGAENWPGRGGATHLFLAVKAGYPMFWINVSLAWALWPLGRAPAGSAVRT